MSNKRLKRTEAELFVYEPGVVVPRDVAHLLVPPGVEVLQDEVFRDLRHLKEVVLPEGLRVIGRLAFSRCGSLERVSFPSTLVRIDDCAFYRCELLTSNCRLLERVNFPPTLLTIGDWAFFRCASLTTLHFDEGLVEIGDGAFKSTPLTRISLPPTVTVIRDSAFMDCSSLEVLILVDGIRAIGDMAFGGCALEGIVLPATVTSVGYKAFGFCPSLRVVKLSGGIQLIRGFAFEGSNSLNNIRLIPKSLVVTIIADRDGDDFDFEFVSDGMIEPQSEMDRVVIASECFYSMHTAEVTALEIAMTEILQPYPLHEWDNKRERLLALLSPHERRHKEEITTILELGLWKAEMCRSGRTGPGTRAACRVTCNASVIISNVVPFL